MQRTRRNRKPCTSCHLHPIRETWYARLPRQRSLLAPRPIFLCPTIVLIADMALPRIHAPWHRPWNPSPHVPRPLSLHPRYVKSPYPLGRRFSTPPVRRMPYFLFGLCLVGFPSILSMGSFTYTFPRPIADVKVPPFLSSLIPSENPRSTGTLPLPPCASIT
jgi:hypothetical protein